VSQPRQQSILIVEDDANLAEMLCAYFNVQGYGTFSTAWGEASLSLAAEQRPDLILLDIHLPDIDGFTVCSRLREGHLTRSIPVIFLTEVKGRPEKLHGLELGVVDYITKPFDVQELLLRARNILRRAASTGQENPVTGLPEGEAVDSILQTALQAGSPEVGIVTVSLFGLEVFRDMYGFVASDDVLRVAGLSITSAALEVGGADTICGHLDEHTFLVVLPAARTIAFTDRINRRLSNSLDYFYPGDNRGTMAHTTDRLRLWTAALHPAFDGPFESVEALREHLKGIASENLRMRL
jgi:DNA-binding response OmpR family regulator